MNSENAMRRRYEDDLNVGGSGVVIMGIWSIVRVLIEVFIGTKDEFRLDASNELAWIIGMGIVLILIAIISFIVMKIHLYVGLNAIRAAKGKPYKKGYFIGAILLLILVVCGLGTYKEELQKVEKIDTTIAAILVDLTTIYMIIMVIYSTVKIRKLKENKSQE